MNTYRYQFVSQCPHNKEQIIYRLEVDRQSKILVEHIKTACALHSKGYHEDIADSLFNQFGGVQRLEANHHGVTVTTERK